MEEERIQKFEMYFSTTDGKEYHIGDIAPYTASSHYEVITWNVL